MNEKITNYLLKQNKINPSIINSLIDNSNFLDGFTFFWDGDTTNCSQPTNVYIDSETGESVTEICNFYKVFSKTFNLSDFLTFVFLNKEEDNNDEKKTGIRIKTGIEEGRMALVVFENDEENFGFWGDYFAILNIKKAGTFNLYGVNKDGEKLPDTDATFIFDEPGVYFSKSEDAMGVIIYPYLLTNEL